MTNSTLSSTVSTIIKTVAKTLFFIGISPLLPAIGLMWVMSLAENEPAEQTGSEQPVAPSTPRAFSSDSQFSMA
ncbi:MAG: hypothetical protein AB8G99_12895 [Planctomycetaceae bacterium]